MSSRQTPGADVFARTVPLVIERHYFGEHKKASLTAVETDADKALLALRKRLLRMPETQAIRHRDTGFRKWLETVASPFRAGVWLVPVGMVEKVDDAARVWEAERRELVEVAGSAYPVQVEKMREPLGPLFNTLDYPPTDVFKAQFWIDWRFIDFGVPAVLQSVRAEVFERERQKLEAAGQKATDMIEQHLAGQLLEITEHLSDLLAPRAGGTARSTGCSPTSTRSRRATSPGSRTSKR
jgi:hypothetical protein